MIDKKERERIEITRATLLNVLIGMEAAEAYKLVTSCGLDFRVIQEDGKAHMLSQDIDDNRVGFTIENNKVTKAHFG